MPSAPRFSLLIPTRGRPRYLEPLLADLAAQDVPRETYEVVVIDDSPDGSASALVERASALGAELRLVSTGGSKGGNVARAAGMDVARGELIVLLDDDERIAPGWLAALEAGIAAAPEADCYGGPIRLWLAPGHARWCGREPHPVTSLDHGPADRWVDLVYGGNMAIRRTALTRIGPFDPAQVRNEETEWLLRLRRSGGLVRYVADAEVTHTRLSGDASARRLIRLTRANAWSNVEFDRQMRLARREPEILREVLRLTVHAVRRRCWGGAAAAIRGYTYLWASYRARLRGRGDGRRVTRGS